MTQFSYSFVIPVLNGKETLSDLLVSLQNQIYTNFEIIVVDNCSVDGSQDIVQKFKAVKYFYYANRGRSQARNFGAAQPTNQYLAFIDCDVKLSPDWLFEINRYMENFPLMGLATAIIPIAEDGLGSLDKYRIAWGAFKTRGKHLSMLKPESVAPCINSAACVYERKAFLFENGFNEDLRFDEDLDLSVRFF